MTTATVAGTVQLTFVTFTGGAEGTPGSQIQWGDLNPAGGNVDQTLTFGPDLDLDVGVDSLSGPETGLLFTGYTIESGGVNYPVFSDGSGTYVVAINENGIGQSTIPTSGTSNTYSDPAFGFLCFAAGTSIATPNGDVAVEDLSIGDEVLTADGTSVPVKWLGRQTVATRFAVPERLSMVEFAAGSLGHDLPTSDLMVTSDHAMLIDGVLCNASALVNGSTITRVPAADLGDQYTVYHVETAEHDIILANGAAAETFIDNVSRRVFDNFAEFQSLYGDETEMTELAYPRAMSARQVPTSIKARLAVKAAA